MLVAIPNPNCFPRLERVKWGSTESEQLAKQLLGQAMDRWAHVQLVARTLQRMDVGRLPDTSVSAAWLHDVGYARQLVHTGMHAIDGAAFLDRAGAPTEVVSLVAFHTGAEFEAEERGLVDALLQFDRPPQDQLDMLILADLLSGPKGQPIAVGDRLDEIPRRYEPHHPVHRAVQRSRPYLEECAARAAAAVGYPM